jgi:hypothetical protein
MNKPNAKLPATGMVVIDAGMYGYGTTTWLKWRCRACGHIEEGQYKGTPENHRQPRQCCRCDNVPPQRLGVDEFLKRQLPRIKITFDGHEVKECLAYDAVDGWVEIFARDGDDNLIVIDKDKPSAHVGKLRLRGVVKVEWQ